MRISSHILAILAALVVWVILIRLLGLPVNWLTVMAPWIGAVCAFVFGMIQAFFLGMWDALFSNKPTRRPRR